MEPIPFKRSLSEPLSIASPKERRVINCISMISEEFVAAASNVVSIYKVEDKKLVETVKVCMVY